MLDSRTRRILAQKEEPAGFPASNATSIRPLYFLDVDLFHLENRLHNSLGFFRIGIINHLDQNFWNNLPRHAVFVLEPAAHLRFFIPAFREVAPVMINFCLRLAIDLEGNGFVEFENRTTIGAVNACPSSSKATVITVPADLR